MTGRQGSVGRAILVQKAPFAIRSEHGLQIVVRISRSIPGRTVADLEVEHILIARVDELMGIAAAGTKARAHAGSERRVASVGAQHWPPGKDVDEFILLRMRMTQC